VGYTNLINKFLTADLAIVGGGLAGLSSVLFTDLLFNDELKERTSIVLISKSSLGFATSTYYSAGAFRCPINGYSHEAYLRDVLESGRYVNRRPLVNALVSESLESVLLLEKVGIKFKSSEGVLRVVSDDFIFPGKELVLALRSYVLSKKNVKILENTYVLDVILGSNGSFYVICLSGNGDWILINSKVILLATGGAANVYIRSDNPSQLTCDGHGIALRLGLPLIDMEFIQFFPLGIAVEGRPSFMIGFTKGKLVNRRGEDLIKKYGLDSLGRAVVYHRDKLSRYMMKEVNDGNDVNGALLLYPDLQEDGLSSGYVLMRRLNLSPPIKVLPTAHFSMGGVEVDEHCRTAIKGFYAVGELMGGVHGANRLGGNALTACVVFAKKAVEDIKNYIEKEFKDSVGRQVDTEVLRNVIERYNVREGPYDAGNLRNEIRSIMWSKVGVIRSAQTISESINKLSNILENLHKIKIITRHDVVKYVEVENTLLTSLAIAHASLTRTESRGSHYRVDYPNEDPNWIKNIIIKYSNGKYTINVEQVK